MNFPIDPKLTALRIEAAKTQHYNPAATPSQKMDAAKRWSDLSSRLMLEKKLVFWRRLFGALAFLIGTWSVGMTIISFIGIKFSSDHSWMGSYVFWGVMLASALTINAYVKHKLAKLGEEIDSEYPI